MIAKSVAVRNISIPPSAPRPQRRGQCSEPACSGRWHMALQR
jgi:hypothetical protein